MNTMLSLHILREKRGVRGLNNVMILMRESELDNVSIIFI